MKLTTMIDKCVSLDPRPDLIDDSNLWQCVLETAIHADPFPETPNSIYGLLHGLRCGGATLEVSKQGKLRLDYSTLIEVGIWTDRDLRSNWLLPAASGIKQVFRLAEQQFPDVIFQSTTFTVAVGL
jgi:hypothetical protein